MAIKAGVLCLVSCESGYEDGHCDFGEEAAEAKNLSVCMNMPGAVAKPFCLKMATVEEYLKDEATGKYGLGLQGLPFRISDRRRRPTAVTCLKRVSQ